MWFKVFNIFIGTCCFLLISFFAFATDYENWIHLLPESISGQEKAGSPDGANMEMSGESWVTLQQDYSDGSGGDISLTIAGGSGMAPHMQQFQSMKQFSMETEDKVVESVQVSGYEAAYELDKNRESGTLFISLQEETLVIIEADAIDNKAELISLAGDVPLSDIADVK